MTTLQRRICMLALLSSAGIFGSAAPAFANHAWANWHWQRAANPFTVRVRDSTTQTKNLLGGQVWPALLRHATRDWSASSVLDMAVLPPTTLDLALREACPLPPPPPRGCHRVTPGVTW